MTDPFHKQRILFFWASTEPDYPFPTIISMDMPALLEYRKLKQTQTIWHGKVIDLDFLINHAEKLQQSLYIFAISYNDDTECAHIDMQDCIDPPSQPNLL